MFLNLFADPRFLARLSHMGSKHYLLRIKVILSMTFCRIVTQGLVLRLCAVFGQKKQFLVLLLRLSERRISLKAGWR